VSSLVTDTGSPRVSARFTTTEADRMVGIDRGEIRLGCCYQH